MAATAKFLFDLDFASGANPAESPVPQAEHALRLGEAESRGFKDGYASGERDAVAEAERRKAAAFEQIGDALGRMVRGLDAVEKRLTAEAVEVAVAVGRKLAPELIAQQPFAEIAALATDCVRQLNAAPHVVVRVNETLHEVARERLEEIARLRGFDGRLIVMGEPGMALGDCRIEWADGGINRDLGAIDAAIGESVARYIAACRAAAGENSGGST
jgi:flagellar assembly protein FliH